MLREQRSISTPPQCAAVLSKSYFIIIIIIRALFSENITSFLGNATHTLYMCHVHVKYLSSVKKKHLKSRGSYACVL